MPITPLVATPELEVALGSAVERAPEECRCLVSSDKKEPSVCVQTVGRRDAEGVIYQYTIILNLPNPIFCRFLSYYKPEYRIYRGPTFL